MSSAVGVRPCRANAALAQQVLEPRSRIVSPAGERDLVEDLGHQHVLVPPVAVVALGQRDDVLLRPAVLAHQVGEARQAGSLAHDEGRRIVAGGRRCPRGSPPRGRTPRRSACRRGPRGRLGVRVQGERPRGAAARAAEGVGESGAHRAAGTLAMDRAGRSPAPRAAGRCAPAARSLGRPLRDGGLRLVAEPVSVPAPPSAASVSAPPSRRSLSAPPHRRSLPASPKSWSAPAQLFMTSAPAPP